MMNKISLVSNKCFSQILSGFHLSCWPDLFVFHRKTSTLTLIFIIDFLYLHLKFCHMLMISTQFIIYRPEFTFNLSKRFLETNNWSLGFFGLKTSRDLNLVFYFWLTTRYMTTNFKSFQSNIQIYSSLC